MALSAEERRAKQWAEHRGYFETESPTDGAEYVPRLTNKGITWWFRAQLGKGQKMKKSEALAKSMSTPPENRKILKPESRRQLQEGSLIASINAVGEFDQAHITEASREVQFEGPVACSAEAGEKEPAASKNAKDLDSALSPSPCRLFELPQELQDEVFQLAYTQADDRVKVIGEKEWQEQEIERDLNDQDFQPRDFDHKINDFLVSKRFFVAAARAYVENCPCQRRIWTALGMKIFGAFQTSLSMEWLEFDSGFYRDFFSVKDFQVSMDPLDFGCKPPRLAFNTRMQDDQIMKSSSFELLKQMSGLRTLELKTTWESPTANAGTAIWKANLKSLERLVTPFALRPREDTLALSSPMPLYPGSDVLFDCPEPVLGVPGCKPLETKQDQGKPDDKDAVVVPYLGEELDKQSSGLAAVQTEGNKPSKDQVKAIMDRNHDIVVEVLHERATRGVPTGVATDEGKIPETDREILDLMTKDPAAVLAWIRRTQAKEARCKELEATVSSISSTLSGLKLG